MCEPIRHLYVHIPFCAAKCPYCAFVTHVGSLKLVEPYLDALLQEMTSVAAARPGGPFETVYFGGGTPGLLTPDQLGRLLAAIDRTFGLDVDAEVSFEAHPDTAKIDRLRGWRGAGATRLSIGVETTQANELMAIGRFYSADDVRRAVSSAREAGFDNINLDLIYGLPGQDEDSWAGTLEAVLALQPEHVSLYPLSIEPRTVFARQQREGGLVVPSDESVVHMYRRACDELRAAGFVHYEVANWSRPGFAARHNLAYWRNHEYYGIGVGAHAYLKPYRTENERRVKRYLEVISGGATAVVERETVGPDEELSESVMLGLRLLREGLDLAETRRRFGRDLVTERAEDINRLASRGHLIRKDERLFLSESAVPVANEIWALLVP
ncbi:MAG TPA: radical SAM family heme chaperone HemW [Chloroflexota bacterium]|nr:radical SAM family heme chaperone HemW [Chloroflexota bacterium]